MQINAEIIEIIGKKIINKSEKYRKKGKNQKNENSNYFFIN